MSFNWFLTIFVDSFPVQVCCVVKLLVFDTIFQLLDIHGFIPGHVIIRHFLVAVNSSSLGHFSFRGKQGEFWSSQNYLSSKSKHYRKPVRAVFN